MIDADHCTFYPQHMDMYSAKVCTPDIVINLYIIIIIRKYANRLNAVIKAIQVITEYFDISRNGETNFTLVKS